MTLTTPRHRRTLPLAALLLAALPGAALAHATSAPAAGFAQGYGHPFTGLDHLLAMVMVGVLAARTGGRGLWLVPASFLVVMGLGGLLGAGGIALPLVEAGIAVSVILLGAALALDLRAPVLAAMAGVGLFALFHGHAHGAEMPGNAAALAYGAGFMLASAVLHGTGIGLGMVAARMGAPVLRMAGGLASVAGIGLLAGLV